MRIRNTVERGVVEVMEKWFAESTTATARKLGSDWRQGLKKHEATERLEQYGENALTAKAKISPWCIFAEQFKDFMVLVLIGAAGISGFLGEHADALTILAIIFLNAILGFIQEYRAEKSLEALKELSTPQAKVVRNGTTSKIAARDLVPGDLILIESGDRIPADARLGEATELRINESSLTGESNAIKKTTAVINEPNPELGDKYNMIFAGTTVESGHGRAIITATGMETEIGKIADLLDSSDSTATPLQERLDKLGRTLIMICLWVCAAVATMGILRGENPRQMFLSAVSLAVAAIPEGLPAIVTIALALGVQRMIKRRVIVRKLPSVETLGCTTVICSDKTGTLTQNKLSVTRLYDGLRTFEINEADKHFEELRETLSIGVLCNNAVLDEQTQQLTGDPTEGALLALADSMQLNRREILQQQRRIAENPFSSERKRMSVIVEHDGVKRSLVKGATDVILPRCCAYRNRDTVLALTPQQRHRLQTVLDSWSSEGLRVLAFAYRDNLNNTTEAEENLVFCGMVGMTDPPRPETRSALEVARNAGIKVKMITGDHAKTAVAIGKMIGLTATGSQVISGRDLDLMSDSELRRRINNIDIFARVAPIHKMRIVKALKDNGEIVAMTGDGVNDAPAIKEAHIGVAMGISGTDVSKEAASMVIADDNFATIVAAIEEGRTIYDNIRKFIRYLLSCNIGEIITMFGGFLLGLPVVLLPIQILWINLVTDGLPAIALGMDSADNNNMKRPPRAADESIFSRGLGLRIAWQGIIIGGAVLLAYILTVKIASLQMARTVAFNVLVFAQLLFAFRCRSEERWRNPFGNLYLLGAVMISTLMQLAVTYLPTLQGIFQTKSLRLQEWLIITVMLLIASVIKMGKTNNV